MFFPFRSQFLLPVGPALYTLSIQTTLLLYCYCSALNCFIVVVIGQTDLPLFATKTCVYSKPGQSTPISSPQLLTVQYASSPLLDFVQLFTVSKGKEDILLNN